MAIANSDGSIILTTKVDTTGINKGVSNIKGALSSTSKAFVSLGSIIAASLSVTSFINFSREAGEMATQQEASIERLIDIYGEASGALNDFIDTNARALGMSRSAAASFSAVYGNLFSVWADQATNAALTSEYLNMTAVVASKTGRTVSDVQERVRSGLLGNTEAIEDLGIFVNVKTIEMTDAFKRMADGKSWEQLGAYEQQQIRTLAILEQATQKYGNEVAATTSLTRAKFQAAYEDFQATWGQFVNKVLMPILEVATQVLNILTVGMRTIASITGTTVENADGMSSAIGSAVDNQNELTDAVKETNKEMKKSLAGFDEIQILSDQTAQNASSDTTGGGANVFSMDLKKSNKAEEVVNESLVGVMAVAGLALAAIGLILIATGRIAWGIGFLIAGIAIFSISAATLKSDEVSKEVKKALAGALIVAGVVAIILGILVCLVPGKMALGVALIVLGITSIVSAIVLDWDAVKNALKGPMGTALAIVGIVAIVLGILLCFAHKWAIGIGLIVTGALSVGTAVVLNWNAIKEKLQGPLGTVLAIVGTVAIVLGILLCFAHKWGIGIGLILTGALSVGTVVALNWNVIKEKLQGPLGGVLAIVGIVAIVLGILLCFAAMWGIGIGLILTGAVAIGTTVAINWDSIKEKTTKAMEKVGEWVKSWGLLVLGVLLCFTGVGIPLGIALIKRGAENLAKSENPDWQQTGKKIQTTIDSIFTWIKTWGLLVLGIILCLTSVGLPIGLALIKKGAENLTAAKDPTWNAMLDKIKETWGKIKEYWKTNIAKYFTAEWWGTLAKNAINGFLRWFISGINKLIDKLNTFGFTLPEVLGGGWVGFDIERLKVPQLAKGAVLPANKPFLAVVGDQKQGTNIEAPADLIKQMAKEAIQEAGYSGNQTTREEHYYLDETELMKIVYKLVKGGERLNGSSLLNGGAY